ncbi:ABC transporter permease [Teichococcus vastitatis]|jgi:phospholipid/cholesterol/gamma-HCH transport system permease protein|uniref:ABC transporter permease n=1 Tax=Teichococcus vastitatis TaxID=2307076 RepID=A0ABS9W3R7_9PROT|nr:ABC transporter permease [Pseudoroseomonas vastitatis]MCI0753931.1 ABC transporter permease [Pseudoroseomonas vastitatis]
MNQTILRDPPAATTPAAFERQGDLLRFSGMMTTRQVPRIWTEALRAAQGARRIDLSPVSALDTTGATLVLSAAALDDAVVEGASQAVAAVLERARAALAAPRPRPAAAPLPVVGRIGAWGVAGLRSLRAGIAFLGETAAMGAAVLGHPRRLRLADLLRHLDEAGLRAFPLTVLLGTLIGVILAFQSSIPMRMFGAEIYIPPLVGISLIRELGPLIAAVILSGRTGSAYAAELGTMTVNEEVDALRIMGVEPVAMLVLPRLLAAALVMPVLALLMNLSGLLGMTGVMLALGFPTPLVVTQLEQWLTLGSLLGGLGKSVFFGIVIAGIGCRAGLLAGRGPRAVGDAATSAVVGGIVSTVILDGLFAILFFRLGW